jgi:hypothetical protein
MPAKWNDKDEGQRQYIKQSAKESMTKDELVRASGRH